jgi:hypothetical protein
VTRVHLNGDDWEVIGDYPRPLAESLRRALSEERIPSIVKTPFQWVLHTPVIEIETGGYQGAVALFVPVIHAAKARWIADRVGLSAGEALPEGVDLDEMLEGQD